MSPLLDNIPALAIRLAQGSTPTGTPYNLPSELPNIPAETVLSNVITWGLGIFGTVTLLMLMVGGFMYIAAAGQEAQIEKAKKILKSTIIGFVIILLAGIIIYTITFAILRTTVSKGGSSTTNTGTNTTPGNTTNNPANPPEACTEQQAACVQMCANNRQSCTDTEENCNLAEQNCVRYCNDQYYNCIANPN